MAKRIILLILLSALCFAGGVYLFLFIQQEGVEEVQPEKVTGKATLFFAGDMMFDRYIRQKAEEGNYSDILLDFEKKITGADIAVANLEGPITSTSSVSLGTNTSAGGDHFTFTFHPDVAEALKTAGFDALSLANNHSTNLGENGVVQTREYLSGAGLQFFGDPLDESLVSFSTVTNEINVSFVGYNQFGRPSEEQALDEIKRLDEQDHFVIVFPHWGEEYNATPTTAVRGLAHAFVDAGADLIVGAHSHVIGEKEAYKDVPIYYSLGNFVFDQYFQENVRCGLVLEVVLEKTAEETILTNISESNSWLSETGRTLRQECI